MSQVSAIFIGDIVGYQALDFFLEQAPALKERYSADIVIVNGENICDNKGLTEKEAGQIFSAGAHVITTGNHIWENWKSRPLLIDNKRVLRPHNYPAENPGNGFVSVELDSGINFGVVQVQGRTYMSPIDCPFKTVDFCVAKLKQRAGLVFVDFHADATAEKIAMGWHLDGRVTAVFGTHTHTPTADGRILPEGTAYITDVGMTGPYNSVIGLKKEIAIRRFMLQTAHKYETGEGDLRICGAHVIADDVTGIASSIERIEIRKDDL